MTGAWAEPTPAPDPVALHTEAALACFRAYDDRGAIAQIGHIPPALRSDAVVRMLCEALGNLGAAQAAVETARERLAYDPADGLTRAWLIRHCLQCRAAEEAARWAAPLAPLSEDVALLTVSLKALAPQGVTALCGAEATHAGISLRLVRREPGIITGRVRWFGRNTEETAVTLSPTPLAEALHEGRWQSPWPDGATHAVIEFGPSALWAGDGPGGPIDAHGLVRPLFGSGLRPHPFAGHAIDHVTIIVPVHGAVDGALACLDSVAQARPGRMAHTVVVIDDASPDPAAAHALAVSAERHGFAFRRQDRRCGFATTVNRALLEAPPGAVCLLNSDTLAPPGFLDRLAAHASRTVGTVTPLSNHGELTSWPRPFTPNPMPGPEAAEAIDRAASALGLPPVELPNGVGFCLLITPWALAQGGLLDDEAYGEGYGEDIAYCRTLTRLGFVHLCAGDVFVAHHGGASFGARKAARVAVNRRRLLARDPPVMPLTTAWVAADPLASVREALQRRMLAGPATGQPPARPTSKTAQDASNAVAEGTEP
jgi:GT2 family glycosyltransferase